MRAHTKIKYHPLTTVQFTFTKETCLPRSFELKLTRSILWSNSGSALSYNLVFKILISHLIETNGNEILSGCPVSFAWRHPCLILKVVIDDSTRTI